MTEQRAEVPTNPKVMEFTSPHSDTTIYACGVCRLTCPGGREQAEHCCICVKCSGPLDERRRHFVDCSDCEVERRREQEQIRHDKGMALPVVEDHGGPVYVDDWDAWFYDTQGVIDRCHDDEIDPSAVLVQPCVARPADTPNLAEHVLETWWENFKDAEDDLELSKNVAAALAEVQALVEADAPDVWRPYTGGRIALSGDGTGEAS